MSLHPADLPRRSFLYRQLAAEGAQFAARGDAAVAARFPAAGERARLDRLALVDLSPLPRWGVKGPDAPDWLAARGVAVPAEANLAAPTDGGLVARLSRQEHLLLWPQAAGAQALAGLEQAAAADAGAAVYALPRRDSHAWLRLLGPAVPACLAKLCAVDLRLQSFPDLAVAQTMMAKVAVIVVRQDLGPRPAWHLLWDAASADFLWRALQAAASQFDGGPVGLETLEEALGI